MPCAYSVKCIRVHRDLNSHIYWLWANCTSCRIRWIWQATEEQPFSRHIIYIIYHFMYLLLCVPLCEWVSVCVWLYGTIMLSISHCIHISKCNRNHGVYRAHKKERVKCLWSKVEKSDEQKCTHAQSCAPRIQSPIKQKKCFRNCKLQCVQCACMCASNRMHPRRIDQAYVRTQFSLCKWFNTCIACP